MTALDIASLLKDYGPWGLSALFAAVVVALDQRIQTIQNARIGENKLAAAALERQASTNAEVATTLHALREGQTEIMRVATLLQNDVANDDERMRDKIEALAAALERAVRAVETACRGGGK